MKAYLVVPTPFATQSREPAHVTVLLSQITLDSVNWDTEKHVTEKMIFVIQPPSFNVQMVSAFVQEIMKQIMTWTLAHAE
jgi:mitochondrial fission protein ELM1